MTSTRRVIRIVSLLLFMLGLCQTIQASDQHKHKHDDHDRNHNHHDHNRHGHSQHNETGGGLNAGLDTHVHGTAELNIAIEDNQIEIHFSSPAINLLGFEHKAENKEDIAQVKKVEQLLNKRTLLFNLPNQCELITKTIETEHLLQASRPSHQQKTDTHNDIEASYLFKCSNLENLTSIQVKLLKQFPAIEKINAMWITPSAQGAESLTHSHTDIYLN